MISGKFKYEQFISAEQFRDQQDKNRTRTLPDYENYFFLPETEIFFQNLFGKEILSFTELFAAMSALKTEKPKWVDMGGGYGIAQRQLLARGGGNLVETTTVDLNPLEIRNLPLGESNYLAVHDPGILNDQNKPTFLVDNVETIRLPEAADLITSLQSIQYLNNPLAALCSWYNQLADGGFLMVGTAHFWSNWVRYEGNIFDSDPGPFIQILETFRRNGLSFVTTKPLSQYFVEGDLQVNNFGLLVLQKKAGTALRLEAEVTKIFKNSDSYKAIYYEKIDHPIEVTAEGDQRLELTEKYYNILNRILLGRS